MNNVYNKSKQMLRHHINVSFCNVDTVAALHIQHTYISLHVQTP